MGEDFEKAMSGQFSATETQMGTEMYQKMIEHNSVVIEHLRMITKVMADRAKQQQAVVALAFLMSGLLFTPLYLILWKVAVSW